ncbi:hypothetical protein [Brasilonema sp. UFV-L1]|uniref:hypothetical protein n=1 Tax=Brasilonema sp. UFV-L1 TaxID=2234130 RepID=UPI00145E7682|nr:hypothetical protein [Brasilonema sp. UFV-L1]
MDTIKKRINLIPLADFSREVLIVQQPTAQISWFHHCVLLDKVKDFAVIDPTAKTCE